MTDPIQKTEPTVSTEDNGGTPPVTAPAASIGNDNKPAAGEGPAPTQGKHRKYLMIAFNIAAGAGVTAAAKMAAASLMTWACAPALATLVVSSLAVGTAMTVFCHLGQRRAAKKNGTAAPEFFAKANAKIFAKSSFFALVGGALFLGFDDAVQQCIGSTPAQADLPPPAVVPVEQPAPVVTPIAEPPAIEAAPVPAVTCAPVLERAADALKDHAVSDRVQDALDRASSTNARVAAQGAKDLAFFAFNGFDGVPKDPTLALELFQKAAESGNAQAQIDLLYMQFHGIAGVPADPQHALAAMENMKGPRAAMFVEEWSKITQVPAGTSSTFDAKAILQGVKMGCPA